MSLLFRSAALLFAFTSCFAAAQNCQDQLRMSAHGPASATVSARELRIPESAWQHFEKACRAADTGHADSFEREAAKTLALAPDLTEVYILRALLQIQGRQYEAAFATIAAARQIRPNLPWSSVVLAGALSNLHRFDEAAAELDRAGGAEIDRWQWKFEKTRTEIGRRNVEGALRWSARARAEAPATCTDAMLLRADAFQMAGRLQEAVTEMEAYLHSAGELSHRSEVMVVLARTQAALALAKVPILPGK